MKATLENIAAKTGLSISTVSRVLRGESKTVSDNVEMVINTAQELNYPVNTRLLNSIYQYKKSTHVALITNFSEGEFYASFFNGLSQSTEGSNIYLCLYNYNTIETNLLDFIRYLSNNNFDAAILFLPTLKEHDYYQIIENVPDNFTLLSTAPVFHPVLDTVTFDSYRGGYIIGKHFDDQKYEDVGIIIGPTDRHESLLRKSGFTDYVDHKSKMNLCWQFGGDFTFESGQRAYQYYKESSHKPRAIFGSNDYVCLGFMEEALKDGVRIPEDLAIAGYDNLPICDLFSPSLTSVDTNYRKLGESVFSLLNEKIEKDKGHSGVFSVVPVSLKVRNSS